MKKWHLIDKTCDCCWLLFLKIGFSYVYACIWGVELRHIHKISPSSLLNPSLTSVSNGPNFIFKYKDFVIPSEAETIGFRGNSQNSQHYSNIKSTELLRKNTKTSLSDARMPSTGRCPFFFFFYNNGSLITRKMWEWIMSSDHRWIFCVQSNLTHAQCCDPSSTASLPLLWCSVLAGKFILMDKSERKRMRSDIIIHFFSKEVSHWFLLFSFLLEKIPLRFWSALTC